jgi:hypothetical protein
MSAGLEFTEQELAAIRSEFCRGFNDEQFQVCMAFCRVRNLLPGKHVVFQLRTASEWDEVVGAKVKKTRIVFITTIDASRLIAQRSGEYLGQAPEQYVYLDENGSPSIVSEIPLPQTPLPPKGVQALPREPWAVRTSVFRKGFIQPITSIARFDAYAATYNSANGPRLSDMWVRRGAEQLAKCSEMLSLRKAFPEELSSLYIAEEFKPDAEEPPVAVTPASVVPLPPPVPSVNQTPATPTEAPRPGEQHAEQTKSGIPPETSNDRAEIHRVGEQSSVQLSTESASEVCAKTPPPETAQQEGSEKTEPGKKRVRKLKENPVNGRDIASEGGITQADVEYAGKPVPFVADIAERRAEAEAFVESLDPTPTKEEMAVFAARTRALVAVGAVSSDLKNYILNHAKKSDTKQLTVQNWKAALAKLEEERDNGNLVEATKSAPLPAF